VLGPRCSVLGARGLRGGGRVLWHDGSGITGKLTRAVSQIMLGPTYDLPPLRLHTIYDLPPLRLHTIYAYAYVRFTSPTHTPRFTSPTPTPTIYLGLTRGQSPNYFDQKKKKKKFAASDAKRASMMQRPMEGRERLPASPSRSAVDPGRAGRDKGR